jgi:hypothetical protein
MARSCEPDVCLPRSGRRCLIHAPGVRAPPRGAHQKLHASSIAHSVPPMGAPNAALMPAAAPALTNSRWSGAGGCQAGQVRTGVLEGAQTLPPLLLTRHQSTHS